MIPSVNVVDPGIADAETQRKDGLVKSDVGGTLSEQNPICFIAAGFLLFFGLEKLFKLYRLKTTW